jgi:hypothetical protein
MQKFNLTNDIFNVKSLSISILIAILDVLLHIFSVYNAEISKIDKSSLAKFGIKISSEFNFFEVLASAHYPYITSILSSIIFVLIPNIFLIFLIKKCILNETHVGWKRLAIAAPLALVIQQLIDQNKFSFSNVIFISIYSPIFVFLMIITGRWVYSGFKKAKI